MSVSTKKNVSSNGVDAFQGTVRQMPRRGLPQLIEKARSEGLSFRDIRERSGGKISLSALNLIHKGQLTNLTCESILHLAKGLGESPTVVFEVATGRSPDVIREDSLRQMLDDFAKLPARERDELEILIDSLKQQIQKRLTRKP